MGKTELMDIHGVDVHSWQRTRRPIKRNEPFLIKLPFFYPTNVKVAWNEVKDASFDQRFLHREG